LTYSQVGGLASNTIIALLEMLGCQESDYIIAEELHADRGRHFHVLAKNKNMWRTQVSLRFLSDNKTNVLSIL